MDSLENHDRSLWNFIPIQLRKYALVPSLREGNGLNLNVHALGEGLDGNAAASRLVGEPLLILGVHVLACTMSVAEPKKSSKQ